MHYRQMTYEVTLISSDHYKNSSVIVDLAMGQIPRFTEHIPRSTERIPRSTERIPCSTERISSFGNEISAQNL